MRNVNKVLVALVVGVAIPLQYVAAYDVSAVLVIGRKEAGEIDFEIEYVYGGRAAEIFFAPAHWIDRKLRPGYWHATYPYPRKSYFIEEDGTGTIIDLYHPR